MKTRHLHNKPSELIKYRYDGYGTRNRLLELINLVKTMKIAIIGRTEILYDTMVKLKRRSRLVA